MVALHANNSLNTDGETKERGGNLWLSALTEQTSDEALCNCAWCVGWDRSGIFHWRLCGMRLALSAQQPMRNLRGLPHRAYRISNRSRRWLDHVAASKQVRQQAGNGAPGGNWRSSLNLYVKSGDLRMVLDPNLPHRGIDI